MTDVPQAGNVFTNSRHGPQGDDSNRFIDLLLSPGKEKEIGGIYIFLHSIPSVIVGERRNVLE